MSTGVQRESRQTTVVVASMRHGPTRRFQACCAVLLNNFFFSPLGRSGALDEGRVRVGDGVAGCVARVPR